MNVKYGLKEVEFKVGSEHTSYVNRPGSTRYLFPVYVNGIAIMEVGTRNSFAFQPGKTYKGWLSINGEIFGEKPKYTPFAYEGQEVSYWEKI